MRVPGPHNDLMDKHEKLVSELSQYTKVTVTQRKHGEGFNIHIGNGHTLVSGTEASQLRVIDGFPDTQQHRLAMVEGKALKAISARDIGGKMEAILDMRDEHIPYLMDEVGRLALSFSHEVNTLQSQGLDLRGNVGSALFTDVNLDVIARSRVVTNSNSKADMAVFIEDVSQLKGGEYSMQYNGSEFVVTLPSGQQTVLPVVKAMCMSMAYA